MVRLDGLAVGRRWISDKFSGFRPCAHWYVSASFKVGCCFATKGHLAFKFSFYVDVRLCVIGSRNGSMCKGLVTEHQLNSRVNDGALLLVHSTCVLNAGLGECSAY